MKLLFLTNFYPPASFGGYEQWCQEIAGLLRRRGHEVLVLTSRHGAEQADTRLEDGVRRELFLEMDFVSLRNSVEFFTNRGARRRRNIESLHDHLERMAPDIVLVWGMWNLDRSLAAEAEARLPGRVVYYLGDYWPVLPSQSEVYWQAPARNWATGLPKAFLRPAARLLLEREAQPNLQFEHVLFCSEFLRSELRRKGMQFHEARVIPGAIDTALYAHAEVEARSSRTAALSLLYTGRLSPEKGVETAIRAVAQLTAALPDRDVFLTIVGSGEADYMNSLRRLGTELGVASRLEFAGAQPKERMPELYRRAEVLLVTSLWPEPFGRVILEAMASGTAVVATATGGSGELVTDGVNGLVFRAGDADDLARRIGELATDPQLRTRLAHAGRQQAIKCFDIGRMAREIEEYLEQIAVAS